MELDEKWIREHLPEDYFRKKVEKYTGLMNRWFLIPHWGQKCDRGRFSVTFILT